MIKVSFMYPYSENARFDIDYYCSHHMPWVAGLLGTTLKGWSADVGLGGGGLLYPVLFEVGTGSDQSGRRFRLVEDGVELVFQVVQDGEWTDGHGFVSQPVPPVDIEVHHWFTATHPESPS